MLKNLLLVASALVCFCCISSEANAQNNWSHEMVQASLDYQKDFAFGGTGPANTGWYAELYLWYPSPWGPAVVYQENDVGTTTAGGAYSGQYKRVDVPCTNWIHPANYYSYHYNDPDTAFFFIN